MSTPSATAPTSRRGTLRWSVAAVATAALVVSGSGLVVFAQSGTGGSQGPQFVPAGATAYVEARLDLPGGQADAMAEMMTAFPGFADPGSFDMKLDEVLAMLTAEMGAAAPEGDLVGDVLTGEIGLALGDLESALMGQDPVILVGLAVADADAAATLLDGLVADAGDSVTISSYNDVTLYTDTSSSPPSTLALHDDWMLLGTGEDTVEGALDTLAGTGPSLADDPAFSAAWSRLPTERLGGAWIDFAPFASLVDLGAMMAEGETGLAIPTDDLAGLLPRDLVASLAAEADRLTLEVMVTPGDEMPGEPIGDSDLALSFPADTQVYLESRELGAWFESTLNGVEDLLASQAAMSGDDLTDPMSGLGDIEALFGEESPLTAMLGVPLPEFLDFVGDSGIGAGLSSDGLWLGIAAEVIDPATADDRVSSLLSVLRLLTMQMEAEGIAIETTDVAGVELTTITLPIDQLLAESGLPIAVGDSISMALTDERLLLGLGDFVQSALLSDGTASLGVSPGYVDALAGDVPNAGVMYVNVSSLLAALDPILSMMAPEWSEIAPYATGLDRLIAVPDVDDEVVSVRMTAIVGR